MSISAKPASIIFDALQKMADAPLLDCPQCSKPELTKLVSAASFKLKGSGWYETDFKNNGRAPPDSGAQAKRDTADKGGRADSKGATSAADKAPAKPATANKSVGS
jgi:putative FmdB family regulatory protein